MLNYPRGAKLPGNCRLPLLVLSSWILVLRHGWSYRLMFQLFHFAHLQLWLCFSNGTPVHTWPQYHQGVSTSAARVDLWAFPLGTKGRGKGRVSPWTYCNITEVCSVLCVFRFLLWGRDGVSSGWKPMCMLFYCKENKVFCGKFNIWLLWCAPQHISASISAYY